VRTVCFVLFCFVLFCFVLFCFVLFCFVLSWAIFDQIQGIAEVKAMPRVKYNERNDNNSEKYLQTYVGEKSSVFKTLAEDHKKDVQMMEYVKKSCEELYLTRTSMRNTRAQHSRTAQRMHSQRICTHAHSFWVYNI
jgi:hypothetical protein